MNPQKSTSNKIRPDGGFEPLAGSFFYGNWRVDKDCLDLPSYMRLMRMNLEWLTRSLMGCEVI